MDIDWSKAPAGADAYLDGRWYKTFPDIKKASQWLDGLWSTPGRLAYENVISDPLTFWRFDQAPAAEPNFGSEARMPNGDIKAKVEFTLKPFTVPVTVTLRETSETISIKQLEPEAISALCDDYRARVFRAAGKDDPRKETD